jgi:hypothetical protein
VSQSKPITRQVFHSPGPVCRSPGCVPIRR